IFAVKGDELALTDRISSGGTMPTSIAVEGTNVAVLNAGGEANVAFFADGRMAAVQPLPGSDPAQIAFSPDGCVLVVTDRAQDSLHILEVSDGHIGEPASFPSSGVTPYGFDFRPDGTLVVTEAAGAQKGKASASSYTLEAGKLVPRSGPVGNTRSEVC